MLIKQFKHYRCIIPFRKVTKIIIYFHRKTKQLIYYHDITVLMQFKIKNVNEYVNDNYQRLLR